jgi:uncharacterized membrane protein
MAVAERWRSLTAWRGRQRARRRAQRQQNREQQLALWGGPVEASRVLAFSDAIFAIAITLLTINLEVRPGLHGAAFTSALHQLLPALGAYALSFLILGQLWLAHHRIFGVIARVDYVVLRSNLLFLGLIALMPFPVRLLSDYSDRPLAVAVYAVAFIAAMVLQLVIWLDVTRPSAGTCSARRSPTRSAPASAGCWAGWWWSSGRSCRWACSLPGTRRWSGR